MRLSLLLLTAALGFAVACEGGGERAGDDKTEEGAEDDDKVAKASTTPMRWQ